MANDSHNKKYKNIWCWLIGRKMGSTKDSNARRSLSRAVSFLSIVLFYLMTSQNFTGTLFDRLLCIIFVLVSIIYFVFVILVIPFLTSHNFKLNPRRLFLDGLNSIIFTILAYAFVYNALGINPPADQIGYNSWDAIYFSAVTFSTLGFGDFSPVASLRLLAALQAIIGNLHLAVIVGAAFLAASLPVENKN